MSYNLVRHAEKPRPMRWKGNPDTPSFLFRSYRKTKEQQEPPR